MTITELIKQGTMYTFDKWRLNEDKPEAYVYMERKPRVLDLVYAEKYEFVLSEHGIYIFLKQSEIAEFLDYHFESVRSNYEAKIKRLQKELKEFEQEIELVKSKLEASDDNN